MRPCCLLVGQGYSSCQQTVRIESANLSSSGLACPLSRHISTSDPNFYQMSCLCVCNVFSSDINSSTFVGSPSSLRLSKAMLAEVSPLSSQTPVSQAGEPVSSRGIETKKRYTGIFHSGAGAPAIGHNSHSRHTASCTALDRGPCVGHTRGGQRTQATNRAGKKTTAPRICIEINGKIALIALCRRGGVSPPPPTGKSQEPPMTRCRRAGTFHFRCTRAYCDNDPIFIWLYLECLTKVPFLRLHLPDWSALQACKTRKCSAPAHTGRRHSVCLPCLLQYCYTSKGICSLLLQVLIMTITAAAHLRSLPTGSSKRFVSSSSLSRACAVHPAGAHQPLYSCTHMEYCNKKASNARMTAGSRLGTLGPTRSVSRQQPAGCRTRARGAGTVHIMAALLLCLATVVHGSINTRADGRHNPRSGQVVLGCEGDEGCLLLCDSCDRTPIAGTGWQEEQTPTRSAADHQSAGSISVPTNSAADHQSAGSISVPTNSAADRQSAGSISVPTNSAADHQSAGDTTPLTTSAADHRLAGSISVPTNSAADLQSIRDRQPVRIKSATPQYEAADGKMGATYGQLHTADGPGRVSDSDAHVNAQHGSIHPTSDSFGQLSSHSKAPTPNQVQGQAGAVSLATANVPGAVKRSQQASSAHGIRVGTGSW